MADFKVIVQYVEAGKGFQEVYYRSASTIQQASVIDTDLQYAFTSFRNPLVSLAKVRVSDVLNNRNTAVVNLNATTTFTPGNPAVTGVAAVFNLNGLTPGGSRRIWLRGLTSSDIVRDPSSGADKPSDNLILRTNYLWRALQTRSFEIRFLTPIGTSPNVYQRITNIDATAGAGSVSLTFAGGVQPAVGSLVKITQVSQKDWPGLTGIFKVLTSSGTAFSIPYNWHQTVAAVPLLKGRWRPVNYLYGIIDSTRAGFGEFSTRITGKSPLGGRGRRSGQRLRLV